MSIDFSTLQNLQQSKHLELLDVIDALRAQGLNEHVDLPQLIVCGDQSSGKSSALAAVSGIPFPKKDNLCTRFATEVSLRRDDGFENNQISVSIVSSVHRSLEERAARDAFSRLIGPDHSLEDTIEQATNVMGLSTLGSAFSSDILRLEVRGPRLPQLTIVDLPGLVHSENKQQSAEDIKLVTQLVEEYMGQERSVILAVVSAKNDYANQIVLTKARKVDPEGRRTLGIITKPDVLYPESMSESSFLSLARNEDVHFSLGWHVIRNSDSNMVGTGDRDEVERRFFEKSRWKTIDAGHRGISSLRDRMSKVLFDQIRKELPALVLEINRAVKDTNEELERMGRSRTTDMERRLFVVELGQRFQNLCHAACDGSYDDAFFQECPDFHRLRAYAQNMSANFGRKLGEIRAFSNKPKSRVASVEKSLVERAKELVRTYRGKELPGTFNPALVGQLFREISAHWATSARAHVDDMWVQSRAAVIAMLGEVADDHVREHCVRILIDPQLAEMRRTVFARLEDYMQVFRRHPITYNHYLTDTVHDTRRARQRDYISTTVRAHFGSRLEFVSGDIDKLVDVSMGRKERNMDEIAAQDLADYAQAYYKVTVKRIIDEIPANVIEPGILTELPKLLDPSKIIVMPKEQIDSISAESTEKARHRETLKAKLDILRQGIVTCQLHVNRISRNASSPQTEGPRTVPHAGVRDVELLEAVRGAENDEGERVEIEEGNSVDIPVVLEKKHVLEDDWFGALGKPRSKKEKKARLIVE